MAANIAISVLLSSDKTREKWLNMTTLVDILAQLVKTRMLTTDKTQRPNIFCKFYAVSTKFSVGHSDRQMAIFCRTFGKFIGLVRRTDGFREDCWFITFRPIAKK